MINPHSRIEYTLYAEPLIDSVPEKDTVQFERRGYYYIDKSRTNSNNPILHFIPTGKSKAMSVVGTKVDLKELTQGKEEKKNPKKQEKKKDKPEKIITEEDKQKAKDAIEKRKKELEEAKKI